MDRPISPNRQPLTDVPRFSALHFRSSSPPPPYAVRHGDVPPYTLPPPTMSPAAALPPGAATFGIYSSPTTSNGISATPTFSSSGHYPPSMTSMGGPVSARSHLHTGVSPHRSVSPFTSRSLVEPQSPHSPAFGLRKDHGSVQLNELRLAGMGANGIGISEPYRAPSPRAVAPPPPPSAAHFSRIIAGVPPVMTMVPPPGLVGPNRYPPRSSSPWGMRPDIMESVSGRHSPAIPPLSLHGLGMPPPLPPMPPMHPMPPQFLPFARPASPTQHTSYLPDDLRERVQSLERQLTGLMTVLTSPREQASPAGDVHAEVPAVLSARHQSSVGQVSRTATPEPRKQRAIGVVDDAIVHLPPLYPEAKPVPVLKLRTRASPAHRQDEASASALWRYPTAPVTEPEKRARRRTVVSRGHEVVHIAAPLGILAGLEAAQLREIEQNDNLMAALRRIEELESDRVRQRIDEERAKRFETQMEKLRRRQVSFDIPQATEDRQAPQAEEISKPKRKRAATAFRQDFATISALLKQDEEDEAEYERQQQAEAAAREPTPEPQPEPPTRWKRSAVGRGAEVVHLAPTTAGPTGTDDWQLALVDMAVEQQRRAEELEAELAEYKQREVRDKRLEQQSSAIKRRNTSLGLGQGLGGPAAPNAAQTAPLVRRRLTVRANPVVELTHLPPVTLNDETKKAPAVAAKAVERMEHAEGKMLEQIDELVNARATIQVMEAEVDRLRRVELENLRLREEADQFRGQLESARTNMQRAQALAQSVSNGLEDNNVASQSPAFLAASMQRREAADAAEIKRLKECLEERQKRLMQVWEDGERREVQIQEKDKMISQLQAENRDLMSSKGGRVDAALTEENEALRNDILQLSHELERMQNYANNEVKHWQMELIRKCAAYDDMVQRAQM